MKGIEILATGAYVPTKVVTNEDFTAIIETSDEWITTRTGMKKRHLSEGEYTWQMAYKAACNAIEKSGITPDDIDMIIVSSVTPDYTAPSMSCMVQRELKIKNCIALDVNAACTGFVYSMDIASKYLMSGSVKNVLVIGAENLTKIADYSDRSTCVLFGDGAAAVILKSGYGKVTSFLGADGNGGKYMVGRRSKPHNAFVKKDIQFEDDLLPESNGEYLYMDGKEVYKFAIKAMPYAVTEVCKAAGIEINDLDVIIPHQANIRIIDTAASRLGISMDKVYVNIQDYGNTSSASIGIALNEAFEKGKIKKCDKVCLVGFGAGLTYGALIFEA